MPSALGGGYAGTGYASKSYGGTLRASGGSPQTVTIGGAATAEALGQPIVPVKPIAFTEAAFGLYSTSVTVPNVGGIGPGQLGGPQINLTVPMQGIGSGETFPNPVVTQTQYRTPLPIGPDFAAGLLHTSVTVPMRGAVPSEAFGQVLIGRSFRLVSISSAETVSAPVIAYLFRVAGVAPGDFGLLSTSVSVPMRGVLSQQAAGTFFAHVTVPMIGVVSAELVEQPFSVGVIVAMTVITSTFDTGNPIVAPGPLSVHTSGVPPGETFGEVRLHDFLLMQGIGSAEAVPPFAAVRTQRHLIAALSDEAIGNPTIPVRPTPANTGAAAGLPLASVNITSRPAGIASSESVGAPIVGAVVAPQGIASAETVTDLPRVVRPAGFTDEAFGLPRVSLPVADQRVFVAGASDEAFGQPALRTFIVAPAGVVPGVVGAPFLNRQMRVPGFAAGAVGVPGVRSFVIDLTGAGVASGEAVGRPSFPAPQTVHMGPGAPSGEAVGQPAWTRGVVFYLIGVPSEETLLGPDFGFGAVYRNIQGLDARGPVSPVGFAQNRQVASVPSGETFGSPQVANVILPIGAASQAAVGRPERPVFGPVARAVVGIGSGEALGPVHFKQTIAPTGVQPGAPGSPSAKAFITVPQVGTASGEAFGDPSLSVTVPISGAASTEAVSQFSVVLFVPVGGVASGEAVSEPRPPAYTEHPAGCDSVEDAGLPTTVQIVAVGSAGELEQVGAPQQAARTELLSSIGPDETVSPVTVGVLVGVGGIGSAETVSPIATNLEERLVGVVSAEALGGFVVHVTEPLKGTASSEQAGLPAIPSVTVHLVGVPSAAVVPGTNTNITIPALGISEYPFEPHVSKLGQPKVTATIFGGQLVGVPSGEQLGFPSRPAQAAHPLGVGSQEAAGRPQRPNQLVRLSGAVSGFRTAGPAITGQHVSIFPGSAPTGEAVGHVAIPALTVRIGGAASAATVSRFTAHQLERLAGAPGSQNVGRPTAVQIVYLAAASSLEAVGTPRTIARLTIAAILSGQAVGGPKLHVTVPIRGAQPGQLGAPTWRSVRIVSLGSVQPAELAGLLSISTAVELRLGGISSTQASGWPLLVIEPVLLLPLGIVSEEAVRLSFVGGIFLVPFQLDTSVSTVTQSVVLLSRSLRVEVLPVTLAPDTIDQQLITITAAEAEAIDVVQRAAAVIAGTPSLETEAHVRTLNVWLEQAGSLTVADARQADTATEERDTTTEVTSVVTVRDYPPPIGGNT